MAMRQIYQQYSMVHSEVNVYSPWEAEQTTACVCSIGESCPHSPIVQRHKLSYCINTIIDDAFIMVYDELLSSTLLYSPL